jgi:hypothetical protein
MLPVLLQTVYAAGLLKRLLQPRRHMLRSPKYQEQEREER